MEEPRNPEPSEGLGDAPNGRLTNLPRPPPALSDNNNAGGGDFSMTAATTEAASPPSRGGGLFPKEIQDMFRLHWMATLTYCGVFWNFGMCVAFLGPTILDLGCTTSTDQKMMSWVFFVQLLATLIGAVAAGYLVQRCNSNYILLVSTIALPITLFLVPFCKVLGALAGVLAVMGLNMGVVDCLANLQMMHIFGDAVPPFLQALHFCYGLGAFVSPMIAEPFLLNEDCSMFLDGYAKVVNGSLPKNSTMPAITLQEAQAMTEVKYAFWIMAAIQIPVAVLVLTQALKLRWRGWRSDHRPLVNSESNVSSLLNDQEVRRSDYRNIDKEFTDNADVVSCKSTSAACSSGQDSDATAPRDKKPTYSPITWFRTPWGLIISVTTLASATGFIFDGMQSSYGGYIYSYALKSVASLSKTEGAYLNATFWGMFSLGRLLSIFIATRLSPAFMLLCNILGCSVAMILMMVMKHDHIALYVGTVIFGLFLSSAMPTALSLAEHYIDFSASVTTCIVVVAAVGEMACPVLVGNLFVSEGPVSLLVFGNIMCWIALVVFIILWFIGRQSPKVQAKTKASFLWFQVVCCRQKPEPEPEDEPVVTKHVKYYTQGSEDSSNIEMNNLPGKDESTVSRRTR